MFGGEKGQLCDLRGVSVDSDSNIIVADTGNKLIKIFSPGGKFLRKIGQGSLTSPVHCVQCDRYLIVSDNQEHCIKFFTYNGNLQHKVGELGQGLGKFRNPCCLSVNTSGHLTVCDSINNRIQVFNLNGKFIGKFEKLKTPRSVAALSNGRIVVAEKYNHGIQILE